MEVHCNLQRGGVGAFDGGSGGSIDLSPLTAVLTGDVSLTSSNTWYSGPAIDLPAGTWLILAQAQYVRNATTAAQVTARITDGTPHHASQNINHASLSGTTLGFAMHALVTLTAAKTVTLQMATTAGSSTSLMKAASPNNGAGNVATRITAIKLA